MDKKAPQTLYYNKERSQKIIENGDGSVEAMSYGTKVNIEESGESSISLQNIASVGINNIIDLRSYSLNNDEGIINHAIVFRNGAEIKLSYYGNGKIHNFQTSGHVVVSVSKDGEVMISMKVPPTSM